MIREATDADCEAVHKFYSNPELNRQVSFPPTTLEKFREQYNKNRQRTAYYLYEEKGEVIGIIGYRRFKGRQDHVSRIGPVLVMHGKTGKGIGSTLLDHAVNLAQEQGVIRLETLVYPDSERAVNFYKKNGYVVESTCKKFFRIDEKFVDIYMMVRLLEDES